MYWAFKKYLCAIKELVFSASFLQTKTKYILYVCQHFSPDIENSLALITNFIFRGGVVRAHYIAYNL